jgi:hypothetical protein
VIHWTDKLTRTFLLAALLPLSAIRPVSTVSVGTVDAVAGGSLESWLGLGLFLFSTPALTLTTLLPSLLR